MRLCHVIKTEYKLTTFRVALSQKTQQKKQTEILLWINIKEANKNERKEEILPLIAPLWWLWCWCGWWCWVSCCSRNVISRSYSCHRLSWSVRRRLACRSRSWVGKRSMSSISASSSSCSSLLLVVLLLFTLILLLLFTLLFSSLLLLLIWFNKQKQNKQ